MSFAILRLHNTVCNTEMLLTIRLLQVGASRKHNEI